MILKFRTLDLTKLADSDNAELNSKFPQNILHNTDNNNNYCYSV